MNKVSFEKNLMLIIGDLCVNKLMCVFVVIESYGDLLVVICLFINFDLMNFFLVEGFLELK